MKLEEIPVSELILNKDGSVYHLHLRSEHIADNIILTGDPDEFRRSADISIRLK